MELQITSLPRIQVTEASRKVSESAIQTETVELIAVETAIQTVPDVVPTQINEEVHIGPKTV